MNPPQFSGQGRYEIVLSSHLDKHLSYWFQDLTMAHTLGEDGTPITTLTGRFVDQAALHGVLDTIRDLRLALISVNQVDEGPKGGPPAQG